MKSYLSFFYLFLVVFLGFFFFFNTNIAFATSHGTCTLKKQGLNISYCGGSLSMCTVARINSACDNIGSVKSGDSCCTKVLTDQSGKFYDSCSAHPFLNPATCNPADAIQLPGQELYCCLNPTPTSTP